jgi:Protein of unknown function (DUF1566)
MKNSRTRWVRGMGAVVLVGGLLITGWGLGVTAAAPPASNPGNPFQAILDKLDQVLAAITGAAGQGNHTLRWDQKLPAATRFVVLTDFGSEAVLDRNTGLVWGQSPEEGSSTWFVARYICINKTTGGQKGWRLPSIPELASLIDPTVLIPGPTLPPGHPFLNVQGAQYWSATTVANIPDNAWYAQFATGNVNFTSPKTHGVPLVWCVRGGMNADTY